MILESNNKAMEAARAATAKKAKDTVILELKNLTIIADYFVVCSGDSTTQVKAIAEHIDAELREKAIKPLSIEGLSHARWVLIDYGDVIVHIFEDETRAYYELEKLWLDAPRFYVDDTDKTSLQKGLTAKGKH